MKQKGQWIGKLLIPVLAAGLIALSVVHLTSNLKADERDEAFVRLGESAAAQASQIRSAFLGKFRLLETASSLVPAAVLDGGDPEAIAAALTPLAESNMFDTVYFADASGTAYDTGSNALDLSRDALRIAAQDGARAAGRLESGGFAFASPVYLGQTAVGAAIGTLPSSEMRALLSTSLFSGASAFLLSDADGKVLLSADPAASVGGDILSAFAPGSLDAAAAAALRARMQAGESGTFEAVRADLSASGQAQGGIPIYGVYTRLGIFGWYVFASVPVEEFARDHAFIQTNVLTFGAELVLIAGFVALLLVLLEKQRSTAVRSDRERLQQSEESYRLLNELSESVMFEGNHRDGTLRFNRSYVDLFGRAPFLSCVADLKKENPYVFERDRAAYRRMADALTAHAPTASAEFRLYGKTNEPRWFRAEYLTALDYAHRPGRFVGKLTDIDTEKRTMLRLAAGAERDPLTRLLNRASMEQRVDDYLETDGKIGLHALMMIDLDDFKQINDTCGHIAGDQFLTEVADRLRALFRTSDFLCRMGGDEFSIFVRNINSLERVAFKAQNVVDAITQLGRRYDTHPRVSVSVGIVITGKDGDSFAELYKKADAALYRAKHSGKSTYLFASEQDRV